MTLTFSAVLLAGGRSSRMGSDKALLPAPDSGLLLWQRQLRLLEALRPEEIFWSGPQRPGMPGHVRIIPDTVVNAGPLAGISACLDFLQSDLLVVLAIDLPQMKAPFLKNLLTQCSSTSGAVVRHDDCFEPLAAIYPKGLHELAAKHLGAGRFAMQDLIREAVARSLLQVVPLDSKDIRLFKNLNTPADFHEP